MVKTAEVKIEKIEKRTKKVANKAYVWPWNPRSVGASLLGKALNIPVYNSDYMTLDTTTPYTILNWGFTVNYSRSNFNVINDPRRIVEAKKSKVFFKLAGKVTEVPPHTDSIAEAIGWLRDGVEVLAKGGSQSRSANEWATFDEHPLSFVEATHYAQYKKKSAEFVVHVVGPAVVGIEKIVPMVVDDKDVVFNHRFRTRQNGFVTELVEEGYPEHIESDAIKVVEALGLTFGSVHFLWNNVTKKSYALGYEPTPIMSQAIVKGYAEGLKRHL